MFLCGYMFPALLCIYLARVYGIAGLYGNCLLNYFFAFYSLLESPAYLEEFL